MPTLDGLISQVRGQLLGFTLNQEVWAELAQSLTETSTEIRLNGTARDAGRGLLEIGDELILIRQVDQTTGTAHVLGGVNGRGREGTTPSVHSGGTLVSVAPAFPRHYIRLALQDAVRALYPHLVVLDSTEIVNNVAVFEYELPAEAQSIWSVVNQTIGPTKTWTPGVNYRFNANAPSTFATGKSVQLLDGIVPGQHMRVVYTKRPQVPASGGDDWSVTGYPDSVADLAAWAACARLAPALDSGRLQQKAVEASHRSEVVGPQSALRTAAYYQALYQERLAEERKRMWAENPQTQSTQP